MENDLYRASEESLVKSMTKAALKVVTEQTYIELCGSEEDKATVTDLIKDILEGYETLLRNETWLSNTTKDGVVKKIQNMHYFACYSDEYKNFPKIDDANLDNVSLFVYTPLLLSKVLLT